MTECLSQNKSTALTLRETALSQSLPFPHGMFIALQRARRCILCVQLDDVLEALHGEQPLPDEAVHTIRKQLKKVRAALLLLRLALGSPTFKHENTVFHTAARPFARVRDAKVLLDTLDQLTTCCGAQGMALDPTLVRQALAALAGKVPGRVF